MPKYAACPLTYPHASHFWDVSSSRQAQCQGRLMPLRPVLPYDGGTSSGHSGSDTSRERSERADSDGTTGKRQAAVLRLVDGSSAYGSTVHELSRTLGTHHGQTSAALSNLEAAGHVVRLQDRRFRCHVYVTPRNVLERPVYTQPKREPRAVLEARLAAQEALLAALEAAITPLSEAKCENYWSGDCSTSGNRTPDAKYGAERYCWPCRIRHALGAAS